MRASSIVKKDDTADQWKGYVIVELEEHLDLIIARFYPSQDEAATWAKAVKGLFLSDAINAYTLGIKQPLMKRIWNALRGK